MRKRTWLPAKTKRQSKPKLTDDVRQVVEAQLPPIIAKLKQRHCQRPKYPQFNWPDDVFARWHRDALYFVVVMRTPHGGPATGKPMAWMISATPNRVKPTSPGWGEYLKNLKLTPKSK